jgi:hypothetical protein
MLVILNKVLNDASFANLGGSLFRTFKLFNIPFFFDKNKAEFYRYEGLTYGFINYDKKKDVRSHLSFNTKQDKSTLLSNYLHVTTTKNNNSYT